MADSRLDDVREHLSDLKGRLVRGEIDEATYFRVKKELISDLAPKERQALETPPEGAVGPSAVHTSVPSSLAELELAPGTVVFDQWRIVRELGRGGFGVVFEAEELHFGETQAVKVLDPAMTSRPELLARFRREVSVMRRLESRHIVRVYDYREDPAEHLALISMEYVRGGTVRQLRDLARRQEQAVPVAVVVAILDQTLEALAEAHAQGVMHRDVTPGNVLLAGAGPEELLADPTRDPGVKLVDFGIAGLVEHSELSQKTRALGTAPYVAPEALEPKGEVTPAADVYGAGAVAYELLTGKLPLGRFPEPSQTRSDVPAALDRLLPELLDLDPGKRPAARQARKRALAPTTAHGPSRRRWLAVAAVLAVAVLVATFGYVSDWWRPEPGSPPAEEGVEPVAAIGDQEPADGKTSGAESESPSVEEGEEPPAAVADEAPADDEAPAHQEAESPDAAADQEALAAVAASETVIKTQTAEQPTPQPSTVPSGRDEVVGTPREAPPDSWQDPTTAMRFRYIPAGDFTMGSPESEPGRHDGERQHKVTLTRAFWMGETEVTQGQWRTVMGTAPSYFASCGDQCPVERVSWYDAVTFANRLSQLSGLDRCYELSGCEGTAGGGCEGALGSCVGDYRCGTVELTGLDCRGYRLPTEAEWEYAARAGTKTALHTGSLTIRGVCDGPELDEIGWYCGNSEGSTHAAGQKKPNDWGLYDVLGNVREWTWDWHARYETTSVRDPLGPARGSGRVARGGGWFDSARDCRAADRGAGAPGARGDSAGFRLVRTYP